MHVNYVGDGLDDGDDLQEGGGGDNGGGGQDVPSQRRGRFWDGSQVPGSNLTHKQVIASFTRRLMEEEEVVCSSLFCKYQLIDVVLQHLFEGVS